ncbi:MAG: DUF4252 domain-containing protein [Aestuariibaculum sp.]
MKSIINQIITLLAIVMLLVSCNDAPSLQRYFVDHQETPNFITQDLPVSMLNIDESQLTESQQEAYKSVSRLNFLGYKKGENDSLNYKNELNQIKTILNHDDYYDLMEFSDKGNKIVVKYLGEDDEADEIIVFGSSPTMGFAIVRVLGNDMNPEKMANLAGLLKNSNIDEEQFSDILGFFK